MVGKGMVLLRIQHFQQSGRGIAAEVRAQFVHFVEHEHGVDRAGALHGLQNAAWQCADVRAAVAADFGFVAHTAQRDTHEFAAQSLGDGLAQGGFARARRPYKAQNGLATALGLEFAHRDVFQNALFGFGQAVVVGF